MQTCGCTCAVGISEGLGVASEKAEQDVEEFGRKTSRCPREHPRTEARFGCRKMSVSEKEVCRLRPEFRELEGRAQDAVEARNNM